MMFMPRSGNRMEIRRSLQKGTSDVSKVTTPFGLRNSAANKDDPIKEDMTVSEIVSERREPETSENTAVEAERIVTPIPANDRDPQPFSMRRPGRPPPRRPPLRAGQEALKQATRVFRRGVFSIGAFSVAINLLMLSVPIYMFQLSDRVLTSRSLDTLIMLSVIACGGLVTLVFLDSVRRFLLTRIAMKVEALLGGPVLAAALSAATVSASRDVQALRDLQQLRQFVTSPVMLLLFDAPLAPIYFLAGFLIHPILGCIMTGACIVLLGLALLNERLTAKSFAQSGTLGIRASQQAAAQARNAQVIAAMGMTDESIALWGRENANSLRAQVMAMDRNLHISSLSRLMRLITQISLLGTGAYLAMHGELTGGMMVAASLIASRALAPVEGAIEGWRNCVQAKTAYQRVKTLLDLSAREPERTLLPKPEGRLSAEKLLYIPAGTKRTVLNGISFSLEAGESLAIVGPSGGGKSTLARMLVGCILPTAGAVRLDFMDLRNWDRRQLGETMGYLPQDIELFPGTIKANIARLREDISDEAVTRAAELAGVHEMISRFPDGYETEIALDGSPLSGGQKQQIALARAFFNEPRLVVLDEPNANLDPNGEAALERAILRAGEVGITVVLVTQRPSILRCVKRILVLKNGQTVAFGDREQVLPRLSGQGGMAESAVDTARVAPRAAPLNIVPIPDPPSAVPKPGPTPVLHKGEGGEP